MELVGCADMLPGLVSVLAVVGGKLPDEAEDVLPGGALLSVVGEG